MISIAMATYNGTRYIREQIDSILRQTIQDFELVICDDCSTDGTLMIVEEYAKKDSRFVVYKNEINLGYRRNFEGLVYKCRGEYIAFCDQDDIWLPNHLEVLFRGIEGRDVSSADAEIIDATGKSMGFKLSDFTRLRYWPQQPLEQGYTYFYYRNPFPGCNTMYRKSFLQKIYPIHNDNIQLHDTFADTMACVLGKGIGYADEVIMLYRFHGNSVTAGSKKDSQQHPMKCLIRKFVSGIGSPRFRYVKDRVHYCEEIYSRRFSLDERQYEFVRNAREYHQRRNSIWGRFLNLLFDIWHYRKIYNV